LRKACVQRVIVNGFRMKLLLNPFIDAYRKHVLDISGTRAECESIQRLNGASPMRGTAWGNFLVGDRSGQAEKSGRSQRQETPSGQGHVISSLTFNPCQKESC
jgi:hypothetical protein